jgi:signal transduction histidine kinase
MSLRNKLRNPLSIGLALAAFAAAYVKKNARNRTGTAAAIATATDGADRSAELTNLTHRLLIHGEEEKARIARELHDGLGSTLTAVNLDLYWVQQRLADQPALAGRLARAIEVLASTVEIKRRIIHSLRPAALDNLGLSLAIESNVAELEKTSPVPISMDLVNELPPMQPQAAIALYRIFQEAMANAAEHAQATLIEVALRAEAGGVSLEISDDGVAATQSREAPITLGMLTMREHAAAFEGTLAVTHGPGNQGTTVKAFLPHPFREPSKAVVGEL